MKHLIETWNKEWVICVLYDIANNSTFSVDDTLSTTTAVTAAVMTCQQCYMEPSLSAVAWWDSDSATWNRHCQLSPDEIPTVLLGTVIVSCRLMRFRQFYLEPSLSAVAWWDSDSATWNRHRQLSLDEMRDYGACYFHTYTIDTRQLITTQYTNNIAFWSNGACCYAWSFPVTWQRERSHNSIRHSQKLHAARKI